ncbi:MAG TPA: hypothetical protein VLF67_05165 [Candidatus Saccharimonas sp.]|nr:hypothetical protein [Candidatus Saccharimonas sp.]
MGQDVTLPTLLGRVAVTGRHNQRRRTYHLGALLSRGPESVGHRGMATEDCALTDLGRELAQHLMGILGVESLFFRDYQVTVYIGRVFSWAGHDRIHQQVLAAIRALVRVKWLKISTNLKPSTAASEQAAT